MKIQVIGEGCDKCDTLYANVKEAVEEVGIQVELEKVEDLIEIVTLGVMSAPSVMIDGKLVIAGRVAKKDEIMKILKEL